jgi:hypothetical protein
LCDHLTDFAKTLDADASGKVSEDEFVNYVVDYFDYKPIPPE